EALRRARHILHRGRLAVEAAAVCVLLYTPASIALWAVGICTLLALICWLWGQRYRLQLAIEFGHTDAQYLLLRAESYSLLAGILLLCILWPNYLAEYPAYFPAILRNVWLAVGLLGIFSIVLVLTAVHSFQDTQRYDKTLTYQALQELQQ